MTYSIFYCDPPWDYKGREQHNTVEGNKSVQHHYATMTLAELKKLDVESLAEPNALLFLWTSSPHLPQAIELMTSWGFHYKTVAFVWDKQKVNVGYYTLSQCELCLVGKRGAIPTPRGATNIRQFVSQCRTKHSEKPAEVRDRITQMFPSQKKLELFARTAVEGWDCWGNEVQSTVVLPVRP